MNNKNKATFLDALVPIIFLIVSLTYAIMILDVSPHIPLFTSAMVATLIGIFRLKFKWSEIEEGIVETIKMSMSAIIILMIIGMVIGTWILAGIVPTMIYYGLNILSPHIFLIATVLICSIVSLATGSSWTTVGTVGIALIGVGTSLGIPIEIIGGAIISGSYFGDKMSPLSDTTNLAPAMAGSNLFDHIRHMAYTTVPSYIITLILFGVIGFNYVGNDINSESLNVILNGLISNFNISPILLLAPALVILIVIKRIPAIPGLFSGVVIGGAFAFIFQGSDIGNIVNAAHSGYTTVTNITILDELLIRGGLSSMMGTVSLILCAMTFGGVMEKTGMLRAVAEKILKFATNTGNLVLSTILTSIAMNMVAGDQYLAIVIPGRMFKDAYADHNLDPKNLSRVLEDSATLTSPLIPWNTCGAFMITTLGLAPFTYIPYCFLNILNPIISIIYGYTGFSMKSLNIETDM
ncbi:MAG: Na+/H+ antiporter NhaC [Clostridia bacterium]|jgi:NhaC family Na+:H+ antiporter|nr:Na+/H+ antiporter NhaC [Clostridia bacterium]